MTFALNITRSITGQPWRWRGLGADARSPGYQPDDLVAQLLLARGCPPDGVEAHRNPTIRHFMPDPSLFRDMDAAAERLADAVQRGEDVRIFGDYDVDGATSAAPTSGRWSKISMARRERSPHRCMPSSTVGPADPPAPAASRSNARAITSVS